MSPLGRAGAATEPWERTGWLMWVPWLVFLAFPVIAALDEPTTARTVGGLVGTAVFAVVYVLGATVGGAMWGDPGRRGAVYLAVLTAVTLASSAAIGLEVLSFTPFLVAFGTFALPRPACWWWTGVVLAATLATQVLVGPSIGYLFLDFTLVAVAAGVAAGRLASERGEAWSAAQHELTVSGERERVARDVHDVLGHSLTVVSVKAQLAERLVDADPERAKAELVEIQALTRQALAEVRATVGGLRAARLDDEVAAAGRALAAAGVGARLPGDLDVLDPRRRTVAAWAVREAVTNVVRHSGATTCTVDLGPDGLVVTDDGCGPPRVDGNGLRGLRERVAASGGALSVDGVPGGGTRLEVRW